MKGNRIFITFDYELFFGRISGSIDESIIEPTNRLIEIGRRRGVAFTFFVDAGMLCAMKKYGSQAPDLIAKYNMIASQLQLLKKEGHSIQLHVHPHWEDAIYSNGNWVVDISRYRLNQFSANEVVRIISEYHTELKAVVGNGIHAFRAGGWCIQPFSHIDKALRMNGITLDSTLYRDGRMNTATHQFNFRGMPTFDTWRFEDDPMRPVQDGWFMEIPISVTHYSRLFYLSMAFHRLIKTPRYRFLGDGASIGGGRINMLKMILKGGDGVVTLDGFRVRQLHSAFNAFVKANNNGCFVVIGHPKALCHQSFSSLDALAESYPKIFFVM